MVAGSVSSPGLGVCLLPPQDKGRVCFLHRIRGRVFFLQRIRGVCLLPPRLLPPKDKGMCLLPPQDKGACLLPPQDKEACLLPPQDKGVCLRSRGEGEDKECWGVCHEAQYMITDNSKIPPSLALSPSLTIFFILSEHTPRGVCHPPTHTNTHTHPL
jgi:hypothetical protein